MTGAAMCRSGWTNHAQIAFERLRSRQRESHAEDNGEDLVHEGHPGPIPLQRHHRSERMEKRRGASLRRDRCRGRDLRRGNCRAPLVPSEAKRRRAADPRDRSGPVHRSRTRPEHWHPGLHRPGHSVFSQRERAPAGTATQRSLGYSLDISDSLQGSRIRDWGTVGLLGWMGTATPGARGHDLARRDGSRSERVVSRRERSADRSRRLE